jgi:hypothetical protein
MQFFHSKRNWCELMTPKVIPTERVHSIGPVFFRKPFDDNPIPEMAGTNGKQKCVSDESYLSQKSAIKSLTFRVRFVEGEYPEHCVGKTLTRPPRGELDKPPVGNALRDLAFG